MAALASSVSSLSLTSTVRQSVDTKCLLLPSTRLIGPPTTSFVELRLACSDTLLSSKDRPNCLRLPVQCVAMAQQSVPTVSETKTAFLTKFRKPIPSIYNNVIQELIVQQHLLRYNQTYKYDAVFALGFVTVYDQLMDGYPSSQDREAIFRAYIGALNEDPDQYRNDAKALEDWASTKNAQTIVSFKSENGEVESILKDISQRAAEGKFHYSRFFAIGLFRLVERANATDPAVLEQLCKELNVSKLSVDRDLDVYRNLLSKLVQAKELLKEYIDREKKKQVERETSSKSSEALAKVTTMVGQDKGGKLPFSEEEMTKFGISVETRGFGQFTFKHTLNLDEAILEEPAVKDLVDRCHLHKYVEKVGQAMDYVMCVDFLRNFVLTLK